MPNLNQKAVYVCGPYKIDVMKRQLFKDEKPLTVTAKAFDVLVMLADRAGEVVAKDELIDAVWAGSVVEENNLTQQISALRKIFGDRAREHKFIATVPGRGYCFVAPIRESSSEPVGHKKPTRYALFESGSVFGSGLAIAYVFVVCFAAFLFGGQNAGQAGVRPQSIGILTFKSLEADDVRLGVGIRDTLRAKLGSLDDFTVRPGSTDLTESDTLAVGRQMNVDVVLAGSIQRDRDRIRVAVEMVDVRNERIVWGKTFDESAAKVFELQDSIADEVLETLRKPRLSGSILRPTRQLNGAIALAFQNTLPYQPASLCYNS